MATAMRDASGTIEVGGEDEPERLPGIRAWHMVWVREKVKAWLNHNRGAYLRFEVIASVNGYANGRQRLFCSVWKREQRTYEGVRMDVATDPMTGAVYAASHRFRWVDGKWCPLKQEGNGHLRAHPWRL